MVGHEKQRGAPNKDAARAKKTAAKKPANKTPTNRAPLPKQRRRRTQERTEQTRAKLLGSAKEAFCTLGFDGVAIRDLEKAAGVQRGLLIYHFGSKENLWKSVVDDIFSGLDPDLEIRQQMLQDLPEKDHPVFWTRFFVRYSATHPELNRLMVKEAGHDTWRLRYLVTEKVRPRIQGLLQVLKSRFGISDQDLPHWYYLIIGAGAQISTMAEECRLLFGVDPTDEAVINRHADILVNLLLGFGRRNSIGKP